MLCLNYEISEMVSKLLERNCQSSSEIVACEDFSQLGPPLNIWPLKTFACVSLRYRKHHGVVGDNKTKSKKVKKVKKIKNKVKKVIKKSKKK